ncbi:MAG: S1/P1 nuclease [Sphingomonadales bacterium]|nr:S1/P1 nuclease [Sphingomonadales bacterium]MDE2568716.1 S1/P1 nuclease [Sphingomonadales bacterium]
MPQAALAWGGYGHSTIAEIALANVRPQTRVRIARLLAASASLGTPECPVRSIADASVWPDCIRADRDHWAYTFPWHYQTEPVCQSYDVKANCARGACVSGQIERDIRVLKNRGLPRAERLRALAFLVHFVGDIHQPLHSGDDGDAGGNKVRADYGIVPGLNLHWVWDGPLAERAISSARPSLVRRYPPDEKARLGGGTVADWGRESWALAKTFVYPVSTGKDPCADGRPAEAKLTERQIEAAMPVVRKRIEQAGLRLARLLDKTLG